LVTAAEAAALGQFQPTLGSEVVDADRLKTIRSQSTCRIESMDEKREVWTIQLVRTQPKVLPNGELGEPEEQPLTWKAVQEDGLKLDMGLAHALEVRGKIEAAETRGDKRKVAALWRALYERFGDPLLAVDIDRADYGHAVSYLQSHINAKLVSVDASDEKMAPDRVVALVQNNAKRTATKVQVKFAFELTPEESDEAEGDAEEVQSDKFAVIKTIGPMKPGDQVELKANIPPGAGDKVSVSIEGVTMPWPG